MKKIIFNSDCVPVVEYLNVRFKMASKPMVYVCGRNIKLPVENITSLDLILNDEDTMIYSLSIEDGETVEELIFDGLRFELHTEIKPEVLMKDEKFKNALNIGIFSTSPTGDFEGIEKTFDLKGFKINHSFIYKRMCPYKTFVSPHYFALAYPQFTIAEELKEDIDQMNNIVSYHILNTESKSKSLVL